MDILREEFIGLMRFRFNPDWAYSLEADNMNMSQFATTVRNVIGLIRLQLLTSINR